MPNDQQSAVTDLPTLAKMAVETCNTGIIILAANRQIILWNHWMARHARLMRGQAEGQTLFDIFPDLLGSRVQQAVDMALDKGLSSLLSQSLHKPLFALYPASEYHTASLLRLDQLITIAPLQDIAIPVRHCFIQITDMTQVVKREHLLREQALQVQALADEHRANELYLQAILDNALDAIITSNADGSIETSNPAAARIFGYTSQELLECNLADLLPNLASQDSSPLAYPFNPSAKQSLSREALGKRKDGLLVPLDLAISHVLLNDKLLYISVMRDITRRKKAEEALIREKERALVTLESIGDGVITTDESGHVQYMNPVAEEITGWSAQLAQGLALATVFKVYDLSGEDICQILYERCFQSGQIVRLPENALLMNRMRRAYNIEGTLAPIRNPQHQLVGTVLAFHDVSEARQMADQLSYQATHDSLTDLVNRFEFERRLAQLIKDTQRSSTLHHALCYLDLDQFKVVNDTCGHAAGDELLRQISALLKTRVRETDTLARLGGDEFGVLLYDCVLDNAQRVAEDLRETIHDFRFVWENKTFAVGVSVGLVPISAESGTVNNVLSGADAACYAAKDSGRNRIWIYQADDAELAQRHGQMQWASRVTQAIEDKSFLLYCQPIAALHESDQQAILHLELLVRMLDEDGALVLPMAFIPAAERYNMMSTIDRWVITQAFSTYISLGIDPSELLININLSSISLGDEYFLEFLHGEFARFKMPAYAVCFEITETAAIAHLSKALTFIESLKTLGCQFALDDFGSGLSSFAYLKNLPVDFLKIDGAFVQDMVEDPVDCAMVESINNIGRVMQLKTIAESVENLETLHRLREMGVNYVQGYQIAKPRPFSEVDLIEPPCLV